MMKYKGVYDALYAYLEEVINTYKDEDIELNKQVNIEIMNIEDTNGILIQKIGSNPIVSKDITGLKTLVFKFTLKSIQNYTASDNNSKLHIVQSLDKIGEYIENSYRSGKMPELPIEYESDNMELLNTASMIEYNESRITAGIDLSFTYSTYY
nr:MAG TPA: Minor capsid protein from bacteriophage [Caudoviricetes sp.]